MVETSHGFVSFDDSSKKKKQTNKQTNKQTRLNYNYLCSLSTLKYVSSISYAYHRQTVKQLNSIVLLVN